MLELDWGLVPVGVLLSVLKAKIPNLTPVP